MPGRTLSSKPLSVVANPFACPLSPDGFPTAMVAFDPEQLPIGAPPRLIGAQLVRTIVDPRKGEDGRRQSRRSAAVFYDLTPQNIPDTAYHRAFVRSGELLATDASTATVCKAPRLPPSGNVAGVATISDMLAAEATARIGEWRKAHPDDSDPVESWFAATDDKGNKIRPRISGWKFEI